MAGFFDVIVRSRTQTNQILDEQLRFRVSVRYLYIVNLNRQLDIYASPSRSILVGRFWPNAYGFIELPEPTTNLFLDWGDISTENVDEPDLVLWVSLSKIEAIIDRGQRVTFFENELTFGVPQFSMLVPDRAGIDASLMFVANQLDPDTAHSLIGADQATPDTRQILAVMPYTFFGGLPARWNGNVGINGFVSLTPVISSSTINPAANTGGVISFAAAGAGVFHYITAIHIGRTSTAALVGTQQLAITTTNLGTLAFHFGDDVPVAGASITDVSLTFPNPKRSNIANTATTFVFPAPGAGVRWTATVWVITA